LKNVNVVADLQPNSNAVSKGNSGNFDAYYASTGSGGRSAQFPQSMSELYQTGQSGNIQKFSSPALDKVFNDSRGAVTVAQRKEPLSQMSTILLDDAAFTMTFRLEQRNYYTAKMRGLKLVQPEFPGTADIWMSK
jgi:ABC-type transport system substrate-binding protein